MGPAEHNESTGENSKSGKTLHDAKAIEQTIHSQRAAKEML
jgi:hypothetical protein